MEQLCLSINLQVMAATVNSPNPLSPSQTATFSLSPIRSLFSSFPTQTVIISLLLSLLQTRFVYKSDTNSESFHIYLNSELSHFSSQKIQNTMFSFFFCEMARTKTTSKFSDDENTQVERSPSPPQNTVADQTFDQQPLNETPGHTIIPNVIILAFDTPKSSKSKSSKKPIRKPRPIPTRRSQRMKKSSKEPNMSHVNLVSDEEKKTDSNSEEEDSQEPRLTLREMAINQRRKEIATKALPLSTLSDDEMDKTYEEEVEEDPEEEMEEDHEEEMEEDSEQTLTKIV